MKRILSVSLTLAASLLLISEFQLSQNKPAETPPPPIADCTISFTAKSEAGIETVTMADYLPGVLAGEMPALFETQALMAQAVAARTYIMHRMQHGAPNHPEADICNNPACCKAYVSQSQMQQNWGSHFEEYHAKVKDAVSATDGQHLTYDGELIEAVFHSSSAGATEASRSIWNDRAYLVSVDTPETEADVPNYISHVSFSPDILKTQLSEKYPDLEFTTEPAEWFSNFIINESGRVQSVQICQKELTGTQLRSALALRSTAFTVEYADGAFTFHVTGYGHGVGMSQYGANVFAKQGLSYREILAHYYPNTQLTSAAG